MAVEDQNNELDDITDDEAGQLLDGDDSSDDSADDDGKGSGKGSESNPLESERDEWKRRSRKHERDLKATQAELNKIKDKDKTETQRLTEERDSLKTTAEKAADALARMNIAADLAPEGATLAQLRKVAKRLRGDNDEELEADAKELWEDFGPTKTPTAGRPKERLRGGADPSEDPEETDPKKLAALIPRAR
jgi:chromosome segregation ATPase